MSYLPSVTGPGKTERLPQTLLHILHPRTTSDNKSLKSVSSETNTEMDVGIEKM